VETAAKLAATPSVSLDALHSIYKRLKRAYPEQYVIYNLPALAVAQVQPHLRAKLAGLKPLQQPALGLEHLRGWRALLEARSPPSFHTFLSFHQSFTCTTWRPSEGVCVGWARYRAPLTSPLRTGNPKVNIYLLYAGDSLNASGFEDTCCPLLASPSVV
jgi:hypothetical protein